MTREELRRYGALKREEGHLARMIEEACGLPGRTLDGMPQAGRKSDPTADAAQRVGALREQERRVKRELAAIENAVNGLKSPLEREIMRYRYIEGMTWADVGKIMHYSESHLRRIHGRAIRKIERK